MFLKKYWPHLIAILTVLEPFLEPSLKVYISAHPHAALAILLGAAIAMYHKTSPGDQTATAQQQQGNRTLSIIAIVFLLCVLSVPSRAQTTPAPAAPASITNLYAGGISYNNAGSPAIAGSALYAHLVNDGSGTYAFTVVDALPTSVKPLTVTSNFSAGVAQKVLSLGNVPIFVPTAAGVSFSGSNTGWAWSTGGAAVITIKGNWKAIPTVRIAKSSVSGGTGYQPVIGIMFGWGQ